MAELELRLRALGAELDFPGTPELAPQVGARITAARPRRGRLARPRLALVVGLALLALAVAFAVPPARTSILRFLHLGSVTVERVDTLPEAQARPLLAGLGRSVPRAQAERIAGFRMLLPPLEQGPPMRLNVLGTLLATALELPVGGERRRVLLVEMTGEEGFALGKKVVPEATRVVSVTVRGREGLWIEGAPHVLMYTDRFGRVRETTKRFAGNVLLWRLGALTLRLEGPLELQDALRIARTVR